MSVSLRIAVRFLKSSKGQTILIALGIAIGISVQIFIGSLIQGLQKSLVETTIGSASHITVLSDTPDGLIADYDTIVNTIAGTDEPVVHLSPVLDRPGFILTDGRAQSILIRGFDFAAADGIYSLSERLVEGQLPDTDGQVAIGRTLLEDLAADVGDRIEITVLEGTKQSFEITGVFDLQVQSINSSWFLTTRSAVQTLFGQEGNVSAIEMQVDEGLEFSADEIAQSLAALPALTDVQVTNWKAQNEQLLSGLNGQSVSSYMIQLFVVISVVLGIASVLAISVLQKSRQIGILKAMGIQNRQASLIFFFQGFILGIIGGILGVLLGLGLAYSFTLFARNPDGTPVVALLLNPGFFVFSFFVAVVASSLAALIPARKSARLDPIEVIRNG